MPRRRKNVTIQETDELSVKVAKCWRLFRDRMGEVFDTVDEISVQLAFESSFDEKTHHSFSSDDILFPRDVIISPTGAITFVVPTGLSTKTFKYRESDTITATSGSEKQPLNQIIRETFTECFKPVSKFSDIDTFENHLHKEKDLIEVLNNVDDFLRVKRLQIQRADLYSKLPYFGIF